MASKNLYSRLKSLGVIGANEVPNELALSFIKQGYCAPGDVKGAKSALAKLSQIADTAKNEEAFLAVATKTQLPVQLSPSQMAAASGGTASQDGCVVKEGTCVTAAK